MQLQLPDETKSTPFQAGRLFDLRKHQKTAMEMLRQSLRTGHTAPILQAGCGFGKTIVAAHIVDGMISRGLRVAFSVPYISLIEQTIERFEQNGIEPDNIGVIQGSHPRYLPDAHVQICSSQTLTTRGWPDVDAVIVDEAHLMHKSILNWLEIRGQDEAPRFFIGLTATPWAAGMGKYWDDLLRPISTKDLIDQGYLSDFRVLAPFEADMSKVKIVKGDYATGEASKVMQDKKLVGDVVSEWLKHAVHEPTICFAMDRNHARCIHQAFEETGIASAYVDANTPREERDQLGEALKMGRVEVVVSIGCLIAGIDWDVRCILWCRPTKSEILHCQGLGRGLRTAKGKENLIILEFTPTTRELGFVTDIDYETLSMGKNGEAAERKEKRKEKSKPLPKLCPNCTTLVAGDEQTCPSCSQPMPNKRMVRHEDGELVEITPDKKKRKKGDSSTVYLRKLPKQRLYAELLGYAHQHRYKPGWSKAKYKTLHGQWPSNMTQDVEPLPPSPHLVTWVRSENIRWTKSRKN